MGRRYTPAAGGGAGGSLPITGGAVAPVLTDFTARNMVSATAVQEADCIRMATPVNQSVRQGYTKPKVGALLKVTLGLFPEVTGNALMGICLRDSVNGAGLLVGPAGDGAVLRQWNLNAAGGWTASAWQWGFVNFWPGGPMLLRAEDDGVNRVISISYNWGKHWRVANTVARDSVAVMDEVGFAMYSEGQAWQNAMTVVHFSET